VLDNNSHEHTVHYVGSDLGFTKLHSAQFDQINVLFPLFDYLMGSDTLGLDGVQSTVLICGFTTMKVRVKLVVRTISFLTVDIFASASSIFTTVAIVVSDTESSFVLTVADTMDGLAVNSTASIVLIVPVHTLVSTIGG
jgi:hypothetical protein